MQEFIKQILRVWNSDTENITQINEGHHENVCENNDKEKISLERLLYWPEVN